MHHSGSSDLTNGFQQFLRVRMHRFGEDALDVARLDDRPALHHRHPVRHRADHLQIVADEHVAQVVFSLQIRQQLQHLLLDRHVERARRLVEHEHARLQHERARDRDPLALAARELVRIAMQHRPIEADFAQHRDHLVAARVGREPRAMQFEPFGHDPPDRLPRRKRAEGILKYHLHVRAQRDALAPAKACERTALEFDVAVRDPLQPEERHRERRLAGARFADDAERLALPHRHARVRHRGEAPRAEPAREARQLLPELHGDPARAEHDGRDRQHGRHRALRPAVQQALRVRVLGRIEDPLDRPALDEPALLHHRDPLGEAPHEIQIVRDEQHRHPALGRRVTLQFEQQLDDLRADRHVERGGRLVGEQQARPACERHRDHRALPLAARQLVRIAVDALVRPVDPGAREQRDRPRARVALRYAIVQLDRLADLLADREERIERGHRLLEDHRDVRAAQRAHLALALVGERLAREADRAAHVGVAQQAQDRQRGDALAGARFADERDALAAADRKRYVVDGERAAEAHAQPLDRQQRLMRRRRRRRRRAGAARDLRGAHCRRPAARAVSAIRVSSALRSASPMNVSSNSVATSTQNVASEIHHASRFALPCASSSPRLGVGGGTPSPRKSRLVSARIAPLILNGRNVMTGVRLLGSTWRQMICQFVRPIARAART
ncbi:hypothetical protein BURPS1710b_2632 [Burkholderia pseudomallei 1710b]|uniref:Uncharacterized protein n=1 Tax=Burkholderia pseudomallei (strain 1710b) TaxID=320372 RepID=Q3JQY5_BURP1|nr:hypothetical protein BURPS1710b_2632 [Burkholderia pseudomallei 1710b]